MAVRLTGQIDSCSIGKDQLVGDKNRVGKVMVGSIEGFIQLVPDVVATDVGANAGTLKFSVAVCTEYIFLDSSTSSEGWQEQQQQQHDDGQHHYIRYLKQQSFNLY